MPFPILLVIAAVGSIAGAVGAGKHASDSVKNVIDTIKQNKTNK